LEGEFLEARAIDHRWGRGVEMQTATAEPGSARQHEPTSHTVDEPCELSVVIPCLDAADTIARAIDRLVADGWSESWEIIVADNGSRDATRDVVADLAVRHKNLRLVDASGVHMAAFARNVGARAARGRSLVFFDADDIPAKGWLATMGEALKHKAFVACRLDTDSLNEDWTHAVRGRPQSDGLLATSTYPYLPAASGGTIGVRRSIFLQLGGFDETIPGGTEDIEICWRIQLAGYPLEFVREAVVRMRFRHTRRGLFAQARRYARGHWVLRERFRDVPTSMAGPPPPSSDRPAWGSRIAKVPGMLRDLGSRGGRARWIWRLGWYAGLGEGRVDSLKHRTATS
jgi:cellulose synthase/poly-beta-1,6-N-acetylglucosamine synthase-like glycosyltransferase